MFGRKILNKNHLNWDAADNKRNSDGCSMFEDFKDQIGGKNSFLPMIFTCKISCKGNGCFLAWACRAYFTLDVTYPKVSSWKTLAYRLHDPRPKIKYELKLDNKSLRFENKEISG